MFEPWVGSGTENSWTRWIFGSQAELGLKFVCKSLTTILDCLGLTVTWQIALQSLHNRHEH